MQNVNHTNSHGISTFHWIPKSSQKGVSPYPDAITVNLTRRSVPYTLLRDHLKNAKWLVRPPRPFGELRTYSKLGIFNRLTTLSGRL